MFDDTNAKSPPSPAPRPGKPEIEKLVRLAESGEPKALECLRRVMNEIPAVDRALMDAVGDVAALARDALINNATGGGGAVLSSELMRRKMDELRAELAGPNPSPLERLLAERVVLCWFDVNDSDRRFVASADRQSRRDGSNRRFLEACRALAAIRKLGLPAIQLNVARQQVNVAGGAMGARGESE